MAKRRLEIVIVGESAGLNAAFKKAGASAAHFGKQTEGIHARISRSFGSMVGSAVKSAAGFGAAYASIRGAKDAINVTEELAHTTIKLSRGLGLSVEQASKWAAVAQVNGIASKQLTQGFGILSKNAIMASQGYQKQQTKLSALTGSAKDQAKAQAIVTAGAGAQAKEFAALGLTHKQVIAGTKDFSTLLGEVADRFKAMKGGPERAALGMQLFGRGWQTLVPLMRSGSEGMKQQLALADKYGVTFKGKTVHSLEELIKAQRESKFATMGLQVAFGTLLAPALTKAITAVNGFVQGIRTGTGAGGRFADAVQNIWQNVKPLVVSLGHVASAVASFVGHHPAVQKMAGALIAVGVAVKTIRFAGAITGLSTLLGNMGKAGPKAASAGGAVGKSFATKFVAIAAAGVIGWDIGTILRAKSGAARSAGDFLGKNLAEAFGGATTSLQNQLDAAIGQLKTAQAIGQRKFLGRKNQKGHQSSVAHASPLIFGPEGSLADEQTLRDSTQAGFDAKDRAARRADDIRGKRSKSTRQSAIADLTALNQEIARAKQLGPIDLKIAGYEKAIRFKAAISDIRNSIHDLTGGLADKFRTRRGNEIANSADSKELAGLQQTDKDVQDRRTKQQLDQALSDAIAAGDVQAQQQAQDDIDAYARQKREDALQANIDAANANVDNEVTAYQDGLDTQVSALVDSLEQRKTAYADFVDQLAAMGITFTASSDQEQAINLTVNPTGAGNRKKTIKGHKHHHHRASGGPVFAGESYIVGEGGEETFVPNQSGAIIPHGRRAGVTLNHYGDNVFRTATDHDRWANKLAFRLSTA